MMRTVDLIRAIRDGRCQSVQPETIAALADFVAGVVNGTIPDYQASALLMAVYHQGLNLHHTTALTLAMRDSGFCFDLKHLKGAKVDKHSTGGVGDKISLALAPWVASCGVIVPMVSGRGLGHTGGTLDKLEAIPGFNVHLTPKHFIHLLERHGVAMMGQSADFCPADQKLYSLRDVTATVESIPLIVASILAKKLGEGLDALVLDVKVGCGAFMKTLEDGRALASALVAVGTAANVRVRALLTRMEEPLGYAIGNVLEVQEAIAILKQQGPKDTTALTQRLAEEMLVLAGQAPNLAAAQILLQQALDDGRALQKFHDLIVAQGGDSAVIDNPQRLPAAPEQTSITSTHSGYVASIDSYCLGLVAMQLGAGRSVAGAAIDPSVGIIVKACRGDWVTEGSVLAELHHQAFDQVTRHAHTATVQSAFALSATPVQPKPLVIETMGSLV